MKDDERARLRALDRCLELLETALAEGQVRVDGPLAYRLRHLSNHRIIDVVKAAAKAANWDTRPSPKPGIRRTGIVSGRGIACVGYEGENGYSAMVAEVGGHHILGFSTNPDPGPHR